MAGKPTLEDLGVDPASLAWRRSGEGDGSIELAIVTLPGPPHAGEWILMRVAGGDADRILVYDRHEWECFLDGARKGEFDDVTGPGGGSPADSMPSFF